MGAIDQDEGDQPRDAAVAYRSQHRRVPRGPSLSDQEVATIAAWVDARRAWRATAKTRRRRRCSRRTPNGPTVNPILIVRMEKGFKIPASGPDFIPEEHVDPKLTEDRYVKWVQIIPDAWRAVHHAHVYVDLPEGVDKDGLGLNMGSNVGNSMDLIEYGAGNDADVFPDGTAKTAEGGIDLPLRGPLSPLRRRDVRPDARRASSSIPKGVRAEARRHVAPHSHRRRQRLGVEPRARRGSAAARGTQDRDRRAIDADRRADRGEPAACHGVT